MDPSPLTEHKAALAAIEEDCPRWHTWVGVGGVLYASRRRTSPPRVVRAADPDKLREAIERSEAQRRR